MTVSGSTTFLPIFDDLLTEAWERLGLSPTILTGDAARSARRSLQLMMVDWSNRDAPLWQIDRQDTVTAAGVNLYPTPAGTADVLDIWLTDAANDLVLYGVGRDEFFSIPNKAQHGRPTMFWSERRRDLPVIHLWPTPDKAYPITISRLRLPQDVGTLSQSPDVPVLWSEAMAAGLAARLALKFKPERYEMLKVDALDTWTAANGEDRERVPLKIAPNMRGYW